MTTELREYGDGKTIVLYTEDTKVYKALWGLARCFKFVPYHQEQKGKDVLVGVDLYFSKKYQKWLEKKLESLGVPPATIFQI